MNRSTSHRATSISISAAVGALALLTVLLFGNVALAQSAESICGNPFQNHFGPWDYRTARKEDIKIVENAHFTAGVESMTRPKNTMLHEIAQDVAYTLGVFPNHHRALLTMVRLSEKYKRDPPPGTNMSLDCYFDRAIRFRPDDTVARSLYAQFLGKRKRKDEAIQHLEVAIKQAVDNPISQYTIGTVFLELGEFGRALAQAHKARAMGLEWRELEDILKASGRWKDPVQ